VTDLAGLWNAVAAAVTNLLTLDASKSTLEKKADDSSSQSIRMQMMERMQQDRQNLSPARAVAQTPFVRLAGQMILSGNFNPDE
jgi:hypothetical protein